MTRAVVLGGGFAGLLVATVLARHAGSVTVVEAGRYPDGATSRRGVPQGHHSHVLAAGGVPALDALLPGTVDALLRRGAHRRDLTGQALVRGAEGWFRRHETGAYVVSATRWLIDQVVRERVLATGAVTVRERTRVAGLTGGPDAVTGVVVHRDGTEPETIAADLVVDATGRGSRAPRWLAALDGPAVPEEKLDTGLAYATRLYHAPAGPAAVPALLFHPGPGTAGDGQGATLFPVEGGRWIVTLTGTRGGEPPADADGFAAFAAQERFAVLARLLATATPAGPVRSCRSTTNRRRFFERVRGPEGFLAVGDAAVAVNPVYSHGLSVAALGACRLADELDRGGLTPAACPRLQRALAAAADRSWQLATWADRMRAGRRTGPGAAAPGDAARRMLGDRHLTAAAFRAQLLLPPDPEADPGGQDPGEPAGRAYDDRLLSTDEAVAQYPVLADRWSVRSRVRAAAPA